MTQDADTILRGLHCCSKTTPLCEECPYTQPDILCRELELDAIKLIKNLIATNKNLEVSIDRLVSAIDTKSDYILKLEDKLGIDDDR